MSTNQSSTYMQDPLNSGLVSKSRVLKNYLKCKHLFFMLLPVLAYYAIFHYAPMYGVIIAFKEYYPLKGIAGSQWIGFDNFEKLFTGLYFLPVLKNTLILSFYKLIFGFPAPIILCILINEVRHSWFKKSVQTITYLPHFISWVVLAGMVIEILSPSRGPINMLITAFGGKPIFFVGEPAWFRGVLVSSQLWREVGWSSIIYLAAVTNIDPEMYDVAELDGAGRLQRIWNITIPSIMPVITIMLIFAVGNIINDDFDQVFNLLNGKVMSVGEVISTYTYREGISQMNFSYATAVGLFKNMVSFTLVVISNQLAKRINGYSLW